MRSIFDLPVERPVLTAAANLVLVALGLAAVFTLPVREYPDIDPPTVSVRTRYVGAPADIVERQITQVVEDNLAGVDGIRLVRSTSRNESSSINVEFLAGVDLDDAAADVRDKVASVRDELPVDAEEPVIAKANADDQPMMWITLRSDELGPSELTDLAERRITDAIGVVPGVARIDIGGGKRYAMRVWLDRRAMAARGVTPSDVVQALEAENLEAPAGRLETGHQEIVLRAETRVADAAAFRALVLREVDGDRVLLGDVARVEVGVEEYRTALRANGEEAVALGVIRQSNANTLEVASGVRRELEALDGALPASVDLRVDYDESIFVAETLKNVATTLLQVVGVIVAVTWLFLGSLRATLVPAALIPASVIPAFLVAAALGFSVNVLTILAVVLAISLTTDDAVVIVENVRRRQEGGEAQPLASVRATRQVGLATFASAAALVAVILPLGFIAGNVGRLFREFAVVLAAVVLFSTFGALTLAPMLSSRLFRATERRGGVARWVDARLHGLSERYRRAVSGAVARPWIPLGAGAALIAAGVAMFFGTPSELVPTEDRGSLRIRVEAPEGAAFGYTLGKVTRIEEVVAGYAGEDGPVASFLSIVTPGWGGALETNVAFLVIRLAGWGDRDETQEEVQQQLQRELAQITGVQAFASSGPSLGQRRGGQQLRFVISGVDRSDVRGWADAVLERSRGIEGLQNAELDYKDTKPQLSLTVDRERAADLGVTTREIGEALQVVFGSLQVTRFVERGEEYDVIVQGRPDDRRTPRDVDQLQVRSGSEALVPLAAVVALDEEGAVRELNRLDRLAAIALESSLAPGLSLGDAVAELDAVAEEVLPREARTAYLGEARDLQETGGSVYRILGLVLVLVYFVLAAQFESFLLPLVVLAAAPLALAGGVATIWAFGLTVNLYTQIALILLVGLVAKNAILLVEFANQLRSEGRDPRAAAIEAAALRLRPILMTSVATVVGAVPLMVESGAGAEARGALGLVTAGGLTCGTLLTLFVVPALYAWVGRFVPVRSAVAEEVAAQERDAPPDLEPAS